VPGAAADESPHNAGVPPDTAPAPRRPQLATETVVQHLEDLIFHGELEPGDSLPSESELAQALDLSRLTVREAVRALQARGLIEVAHGRRPIVAHPNARPLTDFFSASVRRDPRSLFELLEVRLAIEVHAAQLAALHATPGDLAAIAAHLDVMRRSAEDESAFHQADIRFHAAIAAASGNRMLMFMLEGMEGSLHLSRLESIRGHKSRSDGLAHLIDQHADIYRCIATRDVAGATAEMRRHLVDTRNDLRAAFSLTTIGGAEGRHRPR